MPLPRSLQLTLLLLLQTKQLLGLPPPAEHLLVHRGKAMQDRGLAKVIEVQDAVPLRPVGSLLR